MDRPKQRKRMEVMIAVSTPGDMIVRDVTLTGEDTISDSDVFRWGAKALVDQVSDMIRIGQESRSEVKQQS
jgi:hypothetical protein